MKRRSKGRQKVRTHAWERVHDEAPSVDRMRSQSLPDAPPVGDPSIEPNAILVAYSGQWAWVQWDGKEHLCRIDERVVERTSDALASGDLVRVEWEGSEPMLRGVAPRRTRLSRFHGDGREQVIAANIDVLVIVSAAAQPRFKAGVVDRYLITAERGGVEPILCLNKMDLVEGEPPAIQTYRDLGLRVIDTSCVTGLGVDMLRESLRGRLSALAGQSGVGKSSLINALDPRHGVEVREVSRLTEKGRHTTRRARLYELEGDIRIIDTPGVRQLGIHGLAAEEIDLYFPEIAEAARQCRFRDCRHIQEPGCAVRAAVERGELANVRYASYRRMLEAIEETRR